MYNVWTCVTLKYSIKIRIRGRKGGRLHWMGTLYNNVHVCTPKRV